MPLVAKQDPLKMTLPWKLDSFNARAVFLRAFSRLGADLPKVSLYQVFPLSFEDSKTTDRRTR